MTINLDWQTNATILKTYPKHHRNRWRDKKYAEDAYQTYFYKRLAYGMVVCTLVSHRLQDLKVLGSNLDKDLKFIELEVMQDLWDSKDFWLVITVHGLHPHREGLRLQIYLFIPLSDIMLWWEASIQVDYSTD